MATITALALQWREARATRLEKEKEVATLKEAEDTLKKDLIARLGKAANKAVATGGRIIQLVTKDQPVVSDWPLLYKHIQKTGDFDLLEKRLGRKAAEYRFDDGQVIPGVSKLPVDTLSDTQAK